MDLLDLIQGKGAKVPPFITLFAERLGSATPLLESAKVMIKEYTPVLACVTRDRDSITKTVRLLRDVLITLARVLNGTEDLSKKKCLLHIPESPDDLIYQLWQSKTGQWMFWPGITESDGTLLCLANARPRSRKIKSKEEKTDKILFTSKLFHEIGRNVPFFTALVERSGYMVYKVLVALVEMEQLLAQTQRETIQAPIRTRSMRRKQARVYTESVLNKLIGYHSLYGQRVQVNHKKRTWSTTFTSHNNVLVRGDELVLPLYTLCKTEVREQAMVSVQVQQVVRAGSSHDGAYCVRIRDQPYLMKVYVGRTPHERKVAQAIAHRLAQMQRTTSVHLPRIIDGVDLLLLQDVPIEFRFYDWIQGIQFGAARGFTQTDKLQWFYEAAAGLHTLHSSELLHNSINTKNILLQRTDSGRQAFLVDLESCVDISNTVQTYRERMFRREVLALLQVFQLSLDDVTFGEEMFPLWSFLSPRPEPPLPLDWDYIPSTPKNAMIKTPTFESPELHPRSEDDDDEEEDIMWDFLETLCSDEKRQCMGSIWDDF